MMFCDKSRPRIEVAPCSRMQREALPKPQPRSMTRMRIDGSTSVPAAKLCQGARTDHLQGDNGDATMRAADHQAAWPIVVSKVQQGTKFATDGADVGFVPIRVIPGGEFVNSAQASCKMQRAVVTYLLSSVVNGLVFGSLHFMVSTGLMPNLGIMGNRARQTSGRASSFTPCSVRAVPQPSSGPRRDRRSCAIGGHPCTSRRAASSLKCLLRRASGSPDR